METTGLRLRSVLIEHQIDTESFELLWEVDFASVYGLTVAGKDAIDRWRYLHQLIEETNHYPILLGEDKERHINTIEFYGSWSEQSDRPRTTDQIIEKALSTDSTELINATAQNFREDMGRSWREDGFCYEQQIGVTIDAMTYAQIGTWSEDGRPNSIFSVHTNPSTLNYLARVFLALVPTERCWQIPAFLRFGGWNACPQPDEHVAIMKRWYDCYGAEVVGITHDVVEMQVARPPQDRESAFRLAQEQFLYCNDLVDQGTNTLNALAVTLLTASVWYFWWD